jgi:hypothetical protein
MDLVAVRVVCLTEVDPEVKGKSPNEVVVVGGGKEVEVVGSG